MFKHLPLLTLISCDYDFELQQDHLINQWWELDGDNLNFNVFLKQDSDSVNEGIVWYNEYSPFYTLSNNDNGGYWNFFDKRELNVELSSVLKDLIVDEGISPISPNSLSFSLVLIEDCYHVELEKLPIKEEAIACHYDGLMR